VLRMGFGPVNEEMPSSNWQAPNLGQGVEHERSSREYRNNRQTYLLGLLRAANPGTDLRPTASCS
jgi:hypothetical protein